MAVRKYKPTTPGRRGASVSDVRRDHAREAREVAASRRAATRPGATCTAASPRATRAAATSAATGSIDFRRNKDGVPAKVAHIEYDPNRSARIALLHYADGEKRYILAPQGVEVGRHADVGARRGDPSRQRAAAAQHPGRHGGARDRAEAGRRREDGPLGRRQRPADGEGGREGHAPAALRRDAAGPGDLQGAPSASVGNAEHELDLARQGRPHPLEATSARRSAASR